MKISFQLLAAIPLLLPFAAQAQPSAAPADPCQHPTYRQCRQSLPIRTFYLDNSSDNPTLPFKIISG
jgi:hypothetical protein